MTMHDFTEEGAAALLSHRAWLERLARTLVREGGAAEDLVQETLATALRKAPADGVPMRSWLGGVLRNLVRQGRRGDDRRAARERAVARSAAGGDHAALLERADAHRALLAEVLALPEAHRVILLQRYFEGRGPGEIARLEGCSAAAVKARLTRAHRALRERLSARGGRESWVTGLVPLLVPLRRSPWPAAAAAKAGLGLAAAAAATFAVASTVTAEGPSAGRTPAVQRAPAIAPLAPATDSLAEVPAVDAEPSRVAAAAADPRPALAVGKEPTAEVILTAIVQGLAVDTLGRPVPDQWVQLARLGRRSPVFESSAVVKARVGVLRTDATGHFAFEGVTPGRYVIGPVGTLPRDLMFAPEQRSDGETVMVRQREPRRDNCPLLDPLTVPEGVATVEVEVRLHRGLTLAGRVVTASGAPAPGVELTARMSGVGSSLAATSGADGAFTFHAMADGDYSLRGRDMGAALVFDGQRRVRAGDEDVVLVATATFDVAGEVQGAGADAQGWVSLVNGAEAGREMVRVMTGVHGEGPFTFDFEDLSPGPYAVLYSCPRDEVWGRADFVIDADVGAPDPVFLDVTGAARVVLEGGSPGRPVEVRILDGATLVGEAYLGDGEARRVAVPHGTLSAEVRPRGGGRTRTIPFRTKLDGPTTIDCDG